MSLKSKKLVFAVGRKFLLAGYSIVCIPIAETVDFSLQDSLLKGHGI